MFVLVCQRHEILHVRVTQQDRLRRDAQCGDLAALESELVTKRDRAAGKRATDFGGGNGLTTTLLKADHLAMQGMETGDGTVKPRLDRVAAILVSLVGNDGVRGEKVQEAVSLSRVVGLEETGDWGG